ncbi:neuropeptide Y receptor Y2, like [Salmo salar]|uniref:Neuropeptide Y receptor type 2 n=1 Tax=Salmo salar TaxID=8030 RepID=A0ABM3F5E1_SALSA|nr:neuropeptide Y receptor type 2-like [Salmo salar]
MDYLSPANISQDASLLFSDAGLHGNDLYPGYRAYDPGIDDPPTEESSSPLQPLYADTPLLDLGGYGPGVGGYGASSLAVLGDTDLLVNTLCLPFTLVYTLLGEWKFGQVLCFLLPYAQGLAVHVSTVTLNVIALDRHRCIVYHLETRMRKDVCFGVIAATWVLSAVLASPLAIFREYGTFNLAPGQSIQVCTEKWPGSSTDGTVYSISMLLLQYILPLAVISFAYARIWSKLRSHVSPAGRDDRHRRRRKTTKMLVTVVAVFAISWLPFHAFQLATDIDSSVLDMRDFRLLYTLFHVVAMCSTFANPLLYGWMNSNYRTAFTTVFRCDQRMDSVHPEGGRGKGGGREERDL